MTGPARLALAGALVLGCGCWVAMPHGQPTRVITTEVRLLDDPTSTALFVGPTAMPIPPQAYIDVINSLFVHCDPAACDSRALPTPEGLYPITGTKSLSLDQSETQGVAVLDAAIARQIAEGHHVVVSGYSQSSGIASLEMADILREAPADRPDPGDLSFVLLGNPSNPNGGLLERFDLPAGTNPAIPSLGITFTGPTPDTDYPTDIYTTEYDGFADFPRYPLDVLSDLNAIFGLLFAHLAYPSLRPDQIAPESATNPGGAIELPTSDAAGVDTHYWMIPTEHLPLLDVLRVIPFVGPLFTDLIEPDMKVLVNLGYGDPDFGWSTGDADVPTPLGFLPGLADLEKVPGALLSGAEAGIKQFVSDLADPAQLSAPGADPIADLLGNPAIQELAGPMLFGGGFGFSLPAGPPTLSLESIVNALSGAVGYGYGAMLPTADIANALLTTMPAYDAAVVADELGHGQLLDAIGLPISADVGLLAMSGAFELLAVTDAVLGAGVDLLSPFVDLSGLAGG